MEKTTKYRGLYMILSVLIAIGLWMYVGDENPEESGYIRNIPVTFVGTEVLESRGLMITGGQNQTVTLNITGKRDEFRLLSAETVTATIDVSSVSQPGQYTQAYLVSYDRSGTASFNSCVVTERTPLNITYTVARQATRNIPVRGTVEGSVADGYQAGEFAFYPGSIEVSGEDSLVNQIEYAQVTLDQENMSVTYSGDLPYTLVSFTGEVIDSAELILSVPLIHTTLPIVQLKEVPLTVDWIYGGGISEETVNDYVKREIQPESIIVSGAEADLEPLKEISLGEVDLAKVLGSNQLSFSIPLANELTNVSGVSEATVKISVSGLTTATLEVDNIEFINKPEGYEAEKVTTSRQVQIRGTAEAVETVTPSQLRIVADLSNAVAATGTQTIPVKVYLDGRGDVGVVGDYNIVISIKR